MRFWRPFRYPTLWKPSTLSCCTRFTVPGWISTPDTSLRRFWRLRSRFQNYALFPIPASVEHVLRITHIVCVTQPVVYIFLCVVVVRAPLYLSEPSMTVSLPNPHSNGGIFKKHWNQYGFRYFKRDCVVYGWLKFKTLHSVVKRKNYVLWPLDFCSNVRFLFA